MPLRTPSVFALVALVFASPLPAQVPAAGAPDPEFPLQPPVQPLSPADEAKTFHLPPGYRMELVLSEPEIKEPTIANFDGDGRLFVAEMRTYMQDVDGTAELEPRSCVSLHWSSKGDGDYDKHTIFADNLLLPRMMQPLEKGRVLIGETNTNDIYLYSDSDGDGVADKKELWFEGGPRGGNLEHQPNGLLWAIDNTMYSTYNNYRLRWTPGGAVKEATAANGGQWGLAQDNIGRIFFMNAGGEKGPQSFQVPVVYGGFNPPQQMEKGYDEVFPLPGTADVQGGQSRFRPEDKSLNHFTATCGAEVYRGDRLPAELQGNLFFGEPVGRLVRRSMVTEKDGLVVLSNPNQAERSEFLRSSDHLFRPVNFTTGPDGALYMVDMYRGIIQEGNWVKEGSYLRKVVLQHGFDKPVSRGRIWRLVHESTQLGPQPHMSVASTAELLGYLEHPNGWWRDTAQKLLVLRQDRGAQGGLEKMVRQGSNPLGRMHALWTLDGLGLASSEVVQAGLKDRDGRVRIAAIRVSERLTKENPALAKEVETLSKDRDPNVVLQSMLTAKLMNWTSAPATIAELASTSQSEGVRLLADTILHPPASTDVSKFTSAEKKLFSTGQGIFETLCATCHGPEGRGLPMVGGLPGMRLAPSLVGSKTVNGLRQAPIQVLLHGLTGEIEGQKYEGQMVSMATFDDTWIASVLSYLRNSFGNQSGFVSPQEVAALRASTAGRQQPWTEAELRASLPQPLANRGEWKLTSSANDKNIARAIDGDLETRWDTATSQAAGQWFQVELPAATEITALNLDYNNSANDFPRGFTVQCSADGQTWGEPVAKGVGLKGRMNVEFPPLRTKFIRINQTAEQKGTFWSIHELQVLAPRPHPERIAAMAP